MERSDYEFPQDGETVLQMCQRRRNDCRGLHGLFFIHLPTGRRFIADAAFFHDEDVKIELDAHHWADDYSVGIPRKCIVIHCLRGSQCRLLEEWPLPMDTFCYLRDPPGPWIYFIQDKVSRAVKIGYSTKPVIGRLKQLQSGNPNRLELIGFLSGGHPEEKALHHRFTRYRRRGEWFRDDAELLHEINLILMTGLPL